MKYTYNKLQCTGVYRRYYWLWLVMEARTRKCAERCQCKKLLSVIPAACRFCVISWAFSLPYTVLTYFKNGCLGLRTVVGIGYNVKDGAGLSVISESQSSGITMMRQNSVKICCKFAQSNIISEKQAII